MLLKHCNFLLSCFYRQSTFRTRKRKSWRLEFVLTCKIHKWNFVASCIVQESLWNHTAWELSQPINTECNPGTRARICQECLFVGSHSAPQRSRNTCSLISCSFRLCSLISWSSCSALSSSWDTSIRACSRLRFKLCRKQNVQYIGFGFSNVCIMKIFSYTIASLTALRHQKKWRHQWWNPNEIHGQCCSYLNRSSPFYKHCLLNLNLSSNLHFLTPGLETKTKHRPQKASIIDSIYLYFIQHY